MKARQLMTLVVVSLVGVTLVSPMRAQAGSQAAGCANANWSALQPSDPAYVDAVELARTLADHGFMIMCIAPSKWTGWFEGQKGAAVYRTDRGASTRCFCRNRRTSTDCKSSSDWRAGNTCTPSSGLRRLGPQIASRVFVLLFSSSTRID